MTPELKARLELKRLKKVKYKYEVYHKKKASDENKKLGKRLHEKPRFGRQGYNTMGAFGRKQEAYYGNQKLNSDSFIKYKGKQTQIRPLLTSDLNWLLYMNEKYPALFHPDLKKKLIIESIEIF